MRWAPTAVALVLAALANVASESEARAEESVIKNPGDHPDYRVELEPHGLVGFGGPFDRGRPDFGGGVRATIVLVDNGFIKTINNSVGIGFGGDIFFRSGTVFLPVVMQWNFWLSTHWSVFGEPGVGFSPNAHKDRFIHPVFMAGGRYHFNEKIALTLRIGYPAATVGASFFF